MGLPQIANLKPPNDLPIRPGYSTSGESVTLWANYVEMVPPLDLTLYRYHIAIEPDVAGRKREQVVRLLLEMPGLAEFRDDVVTDFRSTLISRKGLRRSEYQFPYRAEQEDEPPAKPKIYNVNIQSSGTLSVAQLTDYLASTNLNSVCSEKLPIIQALNILVRYYAKSNPKLAAIGSTKTFSLDSNSTRSEPLGGGLEALRGFFSSVRAATCRILVNVNVSHGAFYQAVPLTELMHQHLRSDPSKLQSLLPKLRVKVTHLPERKNKLGEPISRIKTISGLATIRDGHGLQNPPRVRRNGATPKDVAFFLENSPKSSDQSSGKARGTQEGNQKGGPWGSRGYISVSDYFLQGKCAFLDFSNSIFQCDSHRWLVHKRSLRDSMYPVVNLGTLQNPQYVPAECCEVLPGQAFRSLLDGEQTRLMIGFAARKPYQNARSIYGEGLRTVGLISPNNRILVRPHIARVSQAGRRSLMHNRRTSAYL